MRYALSTAATPDAVEVGGLGDAVQRRALAARLDRLREAGPAALVLELAPAHLGAWPKASEDDLGPALQRLLCDAWLPRADIVVCHVTEAPLLHLGPRAAAANGDLIAHVPDTARRLRAAGARAVCVGGMLDDDGRALVWLDTEHAQGWLASSPPASAGDSPAVNAAFLRTLATAVARGFVAADAAVLASLAAHSPELPLLSWDEEPPAMPAPAPAPSRSLGLYAIVDSAERVLQVLEAGVQTVQLRIKTPAAPPPGWPAWLRSEVQHAIGASRAAGAELYVNDHWQLAHELGASAVHLGQEDLLALGAAGRAALRASGLALGVSSHSLWELCRASALVPRYIACGPVWPTSTKAMPWHPQGLDNLAWWCRMARAPVVAIGGVLSAEQVRDAALCGADGVCVVRGLGEQPRETVPALQAALLAGRSGAVGCGAPAWPHPSLSGTRSKACRWA